MADEPGELKKKEAKRLKKLEEAEAARIAN